MIEPFLIPVNKLSPQEKQEMLSLIQTHFEGIDQQQFEADLTHKHWAIVLKDQGTLKGFSTLQFYEAVLDGEPVRIVYSGDTITDPSMWSSPALSQAWGSAMQEIHRGHSEKLYWLLISSGYRTYRFLSTFFKVFYPRYDQLTPPEIQVFMHRVASQQFKECYNPATGIVRFPKPQVLSSDLRTIPVEKLQDPNVAFFAQKNPGHCEGDELVCLAEASETNMTRAGLRMWTTGQPLRIPYPIGESSESILESVLH